MFTAFIHHADGRTVVTDDADDLPAALREPDTTLWVDLYDPDDEDVFLLDDVFGFHPLAIEDAIHTNERPKIDRYAHGPSRDDDYFLMVIHAAVAVAGDDAAATAGAVRSARQVDEQTDARAEQPAAKPGAKPAAKPGAKASADRDDSGVSFRTREIDVFASARYLVTVHFDPVNALDTLRKRGRVDPDRLLSGGIDGLLHQLLDLLVDNYGPILDRLQADLDDLEEDALNAPTTALLVRIAARKRELLNLRRLIGPQREVLAQLTRGEVPFIREQVRVYLRDVQDHLVRSVELIELYREIVVGTRDIYLSSVSNNLNQIMKTLTIISVIALPLTVVTSFFGMNFESLPGIHNRYAFWVTVVVTLAVEAVMVVLFRRKRWI